jgi:hypothetical protein
MKVNRETIVDAAIINASSSTNNKEKKRDPDMQTRVFCRAFECG